MKQLAVSILILVIGFSLKAQQSYYSDTDGEMQAKYWKYRDQLKKYFMKVGLEQGESIPCRNRAFGYFPGVTNADGPDGEEIMSVMKWGDATMNLGPLCSICYAALKNK